MRDYRRYGLKKKAQYTVIAKDIENNRVTVEASDGEAIESSPRSRRPLNIHSQ